MSSALLCAAVTRTVADDEAAVPRNGGSRPVPDPTVLTDRAIERAVTALAEKVAAELAIRDERLKGIDEATRLRLTGVTDVPSQIDEKVGRLADLTSERFTAAATLATRESALNKDALVAAFNASKEAVAAALTAQKESASVAERTNQAAIDKSERATAETILTNSQLAATRLDLLAKSLDEVKGRVTVIESTKVGNTESRTGLYALIGVIGAGLGILGIVGTFFAARGGA